MTKAGATRHNAQRDRNEPEIVNALRAAGCIVEQISKRGVPDLLVWSPFSKRIVLIEVKDGKQRFKSQRELNGHQKKFHAEWSSAGAPVRVVENIQQAMNAIGIY